MSDLEKSKPVTRQTIQNSRKLINSNSSLKSTTTSETLSSTSSTSKEAFLVSGESNSMALNQDILNTIEKRLNEMENRICGKMDANLASFERKFAALRSEFNQKCDEVSNDVKKNYETACKYQDENESRLDKLERLALQSDLLINGIPYNKEENLVDVLCKLSDAVKYTDDIENSINGIFRIGHQRDSIGKASPIVVKFRSSMAKFSFFNLYMKSKNISLSHIGFNSTDRIFINDSLTKKNAMLFRHARQLYLNRKIQRVFIKNGIVNIEINNSTISIFSENQLLSIVPEQQIDA